ncbi:uncharacterized protein PpBr36_10764 [Pyricularia pennisetigena]|uniref:uncharacterized protein n=1 Tax=Pyricularia pennisetigena TaxID=1578925 RepID=UPI00114DF08C|nr:uncharacterized protein PpBr36_10764 [Pyricularia pennisetigena]TLS21025.1 hypothetical protein PpBr36_10764 [Pyricularia pennisetigena]
MTSGKLPLKKNKHRTTLVEKLNQSIELKGTSDRHDFMQHLMQNLNFPAGISYDEMSMTLSNLLCHNPDALFLGTAKVRNPFTSPKDINSLPYLHAVHGVIQDALRLFPACADNFTADHAALGAFHQRTFRPWRLAGARQPGWRRSDGSNTLPTLTLSDTSGWLPSGILEKENRTSARPSEYEGDARGVLKAVLTSPRNCIGKHLVRAEIRVS